jgi:type 1 fimbria pilin
MGTRRRLATLALLLALGGALAAAAEAEVVQSGNVRVNFHGSFAPQALPRATPAPITVEVEGKISTTDGSQPPPLRRLRVELNSAGQIDTRGLAACTAAALQSTDSELALERCRPAQVGSGSFEARVQFSGTPIPVDGRALVFNGVVGGRAGMLIHIYIARPVQITLVIPLKISHGEGKFGTVLDAKVPKLAGGFGAITELQLKIGRRFSYRGERRSYLSAACAAPRGFPGITFSLARGTFSFAGGRTLHAVLSRNCEVRKSARAG